MGLRIGRCVSCFMTDCECVNCVCYACNGGTCQCDECKAGGHMAPIGARELIKSGPGLLVVSLLARRAVVRDTLNPWGEHQDPLTGDTVVTLNAPTYPDLSVPIAGIHGAPGKCNVPTKGGRDHDGYSWFRCNGFLNHSGPHTP